jgi:hypothetical protein
VSPPLLGRLVVRIYLVCFAQLLVVVVGVGILLHQSRIPESWLRAQGEYVVEQILPVLHDRTGLERALAQLQDTAGARLTLYGPDRGAGQQRRPGAPAASGPARSALRAARRCSSCRWRAPRCSTSRGHRPGASAPGPMDVPMRPPEGAEVGPPPGAFE